jgi:RNA methyltransferase, TrmH family
MEAGYVLDLVRSARRDPDLVRLEGVHALKHALRFGAHVEGIVTPDPAALDRLLADLAPDVHLPVPPVTVDGGTWTALAGRELPSPALSVARRPAVEPEAVLGVRGRVVVLEDPRHLGNVGAVVRVAAAAGAGGVLVVGAADPWHPTAVRGAAGLQYALLVARAEQLPTTDRPVVALDPDGDRLGPGVVPDAAVVLFGTERGGLSDTLRGRATRTVGIPMRTGVSSLNLATAVAVTLYA